MRSDGAAAGQARGSDGAATRSDAQRRGSVRCMRDAVNLSVMQLCAKQLNQLLRRLLKTHKTVPDGGDDDTLPA